MIQPLKAHEMHGGFTPLIDYPEELSPKGRLYFLRSLESWKRNLKKKLDIKLEGMSSAEIMEEERIEREAYLSHQLVHSASNGPISILRAHSQMDLIDHAIKRVTDENIKSDVKLYEAMYSNAPDVTLHDAEVAPMDEFGNLDLEQKQTTKVVKHDKDSTDYLIYADGIYELFKYFRISQFDILTPLEKDILLCEIHKENNNPDLLHEYDLKKKAFTNLSKEEDDEQVDELYNAHVIDVLMKQTKSFLQLYNDFSDMTDQQDNAHNYHIAIEVIHAFENVQILLNESFDDISYRQVLDIMSEGKYEVSLNYDAYDEYQKSIENPRLEIATYDELIANINEGNIDSIDYDDFTHTFKEELSEEGTKSFDSYLQKTINNYAKMLCLPTVDVKEFQEFIFNYDTPRI